MRKIILLFAGALLLASCSNESAFQEEIVTASVVADKIGICHNGGNEIVISDNAVETHQAHGDAVDRDGDGFFDIDNPCSETDCDDTTYSETNSCGLEIGDAYQGGIIAYILKPGDPGYDANVLHGLIAAPSDQGTGIKWYNGSYTTTGATGTALGTGQANTTTIVNNQGAGSYAASLCNELDLGGYRDWYLPSKDELDKLYQNRVAIGGFADNDYWSSTEVNSQQVWDQDFNSGLQTNYQNKDGIDKSDYNGVYVRAVRTF